MKKILTFTLLIVLVGCSSNPQTEYDVEDYVRTDSLVRTIKGMEALTLAADSFAQEGNTLAETMARREIGRLNRTAGEYGEALNAYNKALQLALSIPDTLEIIYI